MSKCLNSGVMQGTNCGFLDHADKVGDVGKACGYFGVARANFYRWRAAYREQGLAGLENRLTAPQNPANRTLWQLQRRFSTSVKLTIWGRSVSSGIWLDTMRSLSQMQLFIAF